MKLRNWKHRDHLGDRYTESIYLMRYFEPLNGHWDGEDEMDVRCLWEIKSIRLLIHFQYWR